MLQRLSFIFIFLACLFFSIQAKAADFAYTPEWLSIVHYQKHWYGYKATIGSSNFYLSLEGRTNPKKELEATILLFQSDDFKTQCLFPARYKLLHKNGLIDAKFPKCDEYNQFRQDLQPSGITLIFTDAYMNNSSSLFGHTLFRIDTARKGTQLLAHGINYGAYTNGYENSFLYAIYGLAGFYPAGFTTKPYYDVINTYNNLENRDIWEYNLNLSPEELDMFVAHIWEVGQTTTPYYFFTLNCSYMLMEVLDAVRPDLHFAVSFSMQTIPLDTVKVVSRHKNLVKSVQYRPSRQRKIQHRINQMSKEQYQAFIKTVKTNEYDITELAATDKADVLETAYQYVQYQYVAGDIELQEYRNKSFKLLKLRNQVASGQKFNELNEGKNPVETHDSAEVSIGSGWFNGDSFQQISIRPAYHSLLDRQYGFLRGAEINFLDVFVRHYDHQDKYVLQRIDIVKLSSLSPITDVFRAPSYQIGVNVERQSNPYDIDDAGYVAKASVAGGATLSIGNNLLVYALSSVDGAYGGFLPNNQWAGVGFTGGLLLNTDKIGTQAEVKHIIASDKKSTKTEWKVTADYYLTQNVALEATFKFIHNYGKNFDETFFRLKKYF